jgi:hypothetical protein
VRFSKIPITAPEIATSRISAAYVAANVVGAFVGACFHYEKKMFEVVAIYESFCRCQSLEHDNRKIDLNIELVNNLVDLFGSYKCRLY